MLPLEALRYTRKLPHLFLLIFLPDLQILRGVAVLLLELTPTRQLGHAFSAMAWTGQETALPPFRASPVRCTSIL
jgi:hypothetical protein